MILNLRDYQDQDVESLRNRFRAGDKSVLYQSATGSGKTIVFCYITEGAARRGNQVLILVHRRELLRQTSQSLHEIGVEHGLIAPGFTPSFDQIQVASIQTMVRRLGQITPPNLIIPDECHHATAGSWKKIFDYYDQANILGVTATPCRLDGKGLGRASGGIFDSMVQGPPISELISRGFLAPPDVYGPPVLADLSSVGKSMGDFAKGKMAYEMDKPKITGNAVEHYRKICSNTPAITFCASVAHAEHVAEEFRRAGYQAASIDGSLHDNERKNRIAALGNGGLHVLTSCEIISEGTDIPVVGAGILLRPTHSLSLYLQQVGRALRMHPGKKCAHILDHVGNWIRHGMPDDDREWSLDGEVSKDKRGAQDKETADGIKQCDKCFCVHRPAPQCPQCGNIYLVQARQLEEEEGELQKVDKETRDAVAIEKRRQVGRAQTLEELQALGKERGYAPGWAHHVHRSRQGRRPGFARR